MAGKTLLTGAEIKLYIGGNVYKVAQSVSYMIDYGESEIYGIDSPFAQEIAPTRIKVSGAVSGLRLTTSGGLQGDGARFGINSIFAAPYVSIRLDNRNTQRDLFFLPNAKITNEKVSVAAKGLVRLNFSFAGIIPMNPLDRE